MCIPIVPFVVSITLCVFILMEFQSTAEPMILRLLEYLARIYKKQKAEVKTQYLASLFPVIPVVIYNGEKRWSEKTILPNISLMFRTELTSTYPISFCWIKQIEKRRKDTGEWRQED